jgi:hypothetical protein
MGWRVLTTANAAGTNGLTCLPKYGGIRDITFLVTHPITIVKRTYRGAIELLIEIYIIMIAIMCLYFFEIFKRIKKEPIE